LYLFLNPEIKLDLIINKNKRSFEKKTNKPEYDSNLKSLIPVSS